MTSDHARSTEFGGRYTPLTLGSWMRYRAHACYPDVHAEVDGVLDWQVVRRKGAGLGVREPSQRGRTAGLTAGRAACPNGDER
jgi:hypothetical protein